MLMELSYFAIRVIDMDKSLKFYSEDLGLKVIDRLSYAPGETIVCLLDEKSGHRLNLMHYTEDCKYYTPYKLDGTELDHLMFVVDDARKIFDELVARGAPIAMDLHERTTDQGMFAMGMIKDPNGIWIGFRGQSK